MNNLHVSLTEFRNESRVLKETDSLISHEVVNQVYIAALYAEGLQEEVYGDKVVLNRFKLSSRNMGKNIIFQAIKYIEFLYLVTIFYRHKDIKIVNIHSVALLPLGILLKLWYKAKLVYDTHELETERNATFGVRKKLSKILEKVLIKKVDLMFVVSENIAVWYEKTYNIQKPKVIFNAPKLFFQKKTNYFRQTLGIKSDSLIILYQGGLAKGRGIDLLLEAFQQRKDDKVVIVFMGYGYYEKNIKNVGEKQKNIFFHPAVNPEVLLEYTSSADIGISFIENTCLSYYYCLPNKLFEYMMVGLPVIVSNMKEMKEIVEKYNAGIVVESETSMAINRAIDEISKMDIEQMKINAKKCAKDYAWEKQEVKMINEYKRILNEN